MDLIYIALNLPYLPEDKYMTVNFNHIKDNKLFSWINIHHL
jgi:hypothetical protein